MTTTALQKSETSAEATQVCSVTPRVDILEDKEQYVLVADVPDVAPGGADVRIEGDALHIDATAKQRGREGGPVRYARSFTLGSKVARDNIGAQLEHGVLRIALPKVPEMQPRRIEVQGLN